MLYTTDALVRLEEMSAAYRKREARVKAYLITVFIIFEWWALSTIGG
jgi:hypothetical protein